MSERLQKFLAAAGVASRRKAEALITAGRVKVNQKVVTELGSKVDPVTDLVTVDGKLVSMAEERSYFLLYKPSGCVTTASDPEGRPTALQYVHGVKARVFPVGRLDYDAEGAVLLTDDGELANRLAHPRYGHARVYLVKVKGDPPAEALERMRAGVRLEDGPAKAIDASVHEHAERNVWIRVVVGEGRYHLVKRLCESVGLQVQRLFRPEFGGVTVDGLRAGQFRALTPAEVRTMKQRVGLASGTPEAPPRPSDLPRAARRHGHGPPTPPGSEPAEAPARAQERRGDRATAGGRERAPEGGRERPGRMQERPGRTQERPGRTQERPGRTQERPGRGGERGAGGAERASAGGRERPGRGGAGPRGPRPGRPSRPGGAKARGRGRAE